jgi:carboxylesterase type B
MTKPIDRDPLYRKRAFDAAIIELCVSWYISYRLSYRDLVEMMAERGVKVAHSTILRWVTRYVPEYEKRWNRFSRTVGTSWRVVAGAGADIDVMVGTTIDEWRFFLVPADAIKYVTAEALAGAVAVYGLPVNETLAAFRAAQPYASPGDLLAALQSDWYCRIPALRLADAHVMSTSATYMYEFAWRSAQFNGLLGACHGLEIAFVFDTLGSGTQPIMGTNPPQQLADMMHAAWVSFAIRGDPGWPKYDLGRRPTMRFNSTSQVVDDPRSMERELWGGVRYFSNHRSNVGRTLAGRSQRRLEVGTP